jgi:hypothetical protein
MSADKEITALLKDIRDLVQVLVMRGSGVPPLLGNFDASERNSRSWSLSAHRNHPKKSDESDDAPANEPI